MTDNVRPILEPDAGQMLCHTEHLFGGDLDGCHQGLIELAWTDPTNGNVSHATLYGTDQLDGLADKAFELNRVPAKTSSSARPCASRARLHPVAAAMTTSSR